MANKRRLQFNKILIGSLQRDADLQRKLNSDLQEFSQNLAHRSNNDMSKATIVQIRR